MTYTVQAGDTFTKIAQKHNLTVAQLLAFNNLAANAVLRIGQVLKVAGSAAPTAAPSAAPAAGGQIYVVQAGDNLSAIGTRFKTTPQAILQANNLAANATIFIGQKLKIPTAAPAPAPAPAPSTGSGTTVTNSTPPPPPPSTPKDPNAKYYTVRQGDTILNVAQQFGISPAKLFELNGMRSNTNIYIGQELKVGAKDTTSSASGKYSVKAGESLLAIANKFGTTPAAILQANGLALDATLFVGQQLVIPVKSSEPQPQPQQPTKPDAPTNYRTYIVQSGDWLGRIANNFRTDSEAIMQLNRMNTNLVNVGQQLMIPAPTKPEIPAALKAQADAVRRARDAYFKLDEVNGEGIMAGGLSGAVSRTGAINPQDLDKVQKRLVQLGFLAPNHTETPALLNQRLGGGVIYGTSIPGTIAALEKFQDRYKPDYWVQTEERVAMVGTRAYTRGGVAPNDATFKLLKEAASYRLTFPNPANNQPITIEFTNFVRSGFTRYYQGVGYAGVVMPELPNEMFTRLGLNQTLVDALKFVSRNEGNFDAINSYDKAYFSFGFIQFAGGGGGFAPLVGCMKLREPQLFQEYFGQFGIDVNYTLKGNEINTAELRLLDLNAENGKYETVGIEAEKALRADKQLYGAFLRSAYDVRFLACQLERAVQGYVRPALSIKASINTGKFSIQNIPLTEIISSPMGIAMMIDLTVNKWINTTRDMFVSAIQKVAVQDGLHSLDALKTIDERRIVQQLVTDYGAADARVTKRGNAMLASNISSGKFQGGTMTA